MMIKFQIMIFVLILAWPLQAAVTLDAPTGYVGMWPPAWVAMSKGGDPAVQDPNPTEGDESHDYDYGKDALGYWANLELISDGNPVLMEMRFIDISENASIHRNPDYGNGKIGAAFRMGAPANEQGARASEKPQYLVPFTEINGERAMWVAAEECNQEFWQAVTGQIMDGTSQKHFVAGEEGQRAVDSRTIAEVEVFLQKLNVLISKEVDLPTEVEWEYLCRAGTATAFNTGRILDGFVGFPGGGLVVNTQNMRFNYDLLEMAAGAADSPNADATTPAWELNVLRITGDGIAIWENLKIPCCGELLIDGSSTMVMDIVAHFDSRYQQRYVPDHYGRYAPVLMLYELVGTDYLPRPYGDSSAANMYYRYGDMPRDYLACGAVEAHLEQNHSHSNSVASASFTFQDPGFAGDWYTPDESTIPRRQLEYSEMIRLEALYQARISSPDERTVNMADWEERFDGNYFMLIDPAGNRRMYPIRSRYTRYRYYNDGSELETTLPIQAKEEEIIEQARNLVPENQKGMNAPEDDMTTEDYVYNYWDTLVDYYNRPDPRPRFSPAFWEPRTSDEIKNINKSDIVAMNSIWEFPRGRVQDRIEVLGADAVKTSVSATARNAWGLLHVHGNLDEWTKSAWDGVSNPENRSGVEFQITRGGSWRAGAERCRSAARTPRDPTEAYDDVGFRFIIRD